MGTALLLCTLLYQARTQRIGCLAGALLIIGAALLPAYLWVERRVVGLPLFPACALTTIWTYAFPLMFEHPSVMSFPLRGKLVGALSVCEFLALGTVSWYLISNRTPRRLKACRMMNEASSGPLLIGALFICTLWTVAGAAGWVHLPDGVFSLVRAAVIAVESLACFVLSYRLGSGKLAQREKVLFISVLTMLLLASLPALLLIASMSLFGIALLSYVTAAKRLPWQVAALGCCFFGFLHVGKSAMRDKYWHDESQYFVQPWHYPSFFVDWFHSSLEAIEEEASNRDPGESLVERASLMQWLLYFEANTPDAVPFLDGATYALIPRMFVPRLFDPEKPRSHEATYLLSYHYGIQSVEDTQQTTIAFGLISEAYANFGFLGIGALGVVLGTFYGWVADWARQTPILSFRALFGVLVASYAFQAEFTSTYYVAALFQSTVVLISGALIFMRVQPISRSSVSLLD